MNKTSFPYKIIGISGDAGSGKSSIAQILASLLRTKKKKHVAVVAMADPVKRLAKQMFPALTEDMLWGPSERREAILPYLQDAKGSLGTCEYQDGDRFVMGPHPKEDVYLTPRAILQRLGHDCGRYLCPDIWVQHFVATATKLLNEGDYWYRPQEGVFVSPIDSDRYDVVICPDVRYQNEVEAIEKMSGFILRVGSGEEEKKEGSWRKHPSETDLESYDFNHILINPKDGLEKLSQDVERFFFGLSGA